MTKRVTSLATVVSALMLAGCVESETEIGTEAQEITKCEFWGCGQNSPKMKTWDFWELEEYGQPNNVGLRLLGLKKGGVTYHANVVGAKLYGTAPGMPMLQGSALAGSHFDLLDPDGAYWQIQIKHVSNNSQFWMGPPTPIETYELLYLKTGSSTHPEPLCKNPPERLDGEGRIWGSTVEAVLFTGDRYDERSKTVTATDPRTAGNWFNIGCAGSVLAKLHYNRHTFAGTIPGFATSLAQRQAMLKMYVSDVCNTGEAFTVMGTKLHWANVTGWAHLTGAEPTHEAFWNADGAMCLDVHRLASDPVIAQDLFATCGQMPACDTLSGYPGGWPPGALFETANP